MATQGYIVDSPNILIMGTNSDTKILTSQKGEIKIGGDTISIEGGWTGFELAEIDTKQTIEISVTDAQFKMDNLALQTGTEVVKGASERYVFDEIYTVATNVITIPYTVVADSVKINGLTETKEATVATKQFKVTAGVDSTTVTFFAGEYVDGTEIHPVFRVAIADAETISVTGTDFPKSGMTVLEYPVYASDDANEESIAGYVQWVVYKTKIKREFNVGGSRKSASTFDMTIKGLDPRRADKKVFDVIFRPVA